MTLRGALESAGFKVEADGNGLRAYCCGEEALHDADMGGIFGPTRVYCPHCDGEIRRREVDRYGIDKSCEPTPDRRTTPHE